QFSVNTLSVVLMMQAAVPHFPNSGGRIVNVSSNIAFRPIEGCAIYCASKAAVSTLTEAFSKELASKKITVNAVRARRDDYAHDCVANRRPAARHRASHPPWEDGGAG